MPKKPNCFRSDKTARGLDGARIKAGARKGAHSGEPGNGNGALGLEVSPAAVVVVVLLSIDRLTAPAPLQSRAQPVFSGWRACLGHWLASHSWASFR